MLLLDINETLISKTKLCVDREQIEVQIIFDFKSFDNRI